MPRKAPILQRGNVIASSRYKFRLVKINYFKCILAPWFNRGQNLMCLLNAWKGRGSLSYLALSHSVWVERSLQKWALPLNSRVFTRVWNGGVGWSSNEYLQSTLRLTCCRGVITLVFFVPSAAPKCRHGDTQGGIKNTGKLTYSGERGRQGNTKWLSWKSVKKQARSNETQTKGERPTKQQKISRRQPTYTKQEHQEKQDKPESMQTTWQLKEWSTLSKYTGAD